MPVHARDPRGLRAPSPTSCGVAARSRRATPVAAACACTASTSSAMPVRSARRDREHRHPAAIVRARSATISRSSPSARSAPGRSALLTTSTSAISRMPALAACTSSPSPGGHTTIVVSASVATSTSDCPAPTVSTITVSNPAASSRSTTRRTGLREAAHLPARRKRADEHAAIGAELAHPDAVAQHRATGDVGSTDRSPLPPPAARAPATRPTTH